jgi:putative dimethyl sulfoxide reductase chaperone
MTSDREHRKDAARATLCRLLAACYYEPAAEFAEERVFEAIVEAASEIDPELAHHAQRVAAAFAADDLERLLVDYTQLFLGAPQANALPYGSVWLPGDRGLMTDQTMTVLALYREGGFDIDDGFRELPDHIAAELEFLYLLLFRESAARRDGRHQEAIAAANLRQRFVRDHLAAWVGPFTAAMWAGAASLFYRELALLTDRFVRQEAAMPGDQAVPDTP